MAGDAVPDYQGTAAAEIAQRAKSLAAVMHGGLQNGAIAHSPSDQRQRREEIPRTGRRGRIEQFPGHDEIRSVGARGDDPEVPWKTKIIEPDAEPSPFERYGRGRRELVIGVSRISRAARPQE